MKKEEFFYDSRDGKSKIHAVRYIPDDGQVKCIIQIIHGMAEYIERYEKMAEYFTDRGFLVTGEDHLGHGQSVNDQVPLGYFAKEDPCTVVVRDAHRLKKLTQPKYPGCPYVFIGHSMGSFILRDYIKRYGSGIDGAIIMGTGSKSSFELMMAKIIVNIYTVIKGPMYKPKLLDKLTIGVYNKRIENYKTKSDWICTINQVVEDYEADSMCGFNFTVNGYGALAEFLLRAESREMMDKIPKELPILVVSGEEDPVGAYGVGVEKVYNKLLATGMDNISMKLYKNARHELFNEFCRDEVLNDIDNWIEGNVLV